MAAKTDKKTLELIQEVKRKKAEIAKAERPNWRTNCSFSYTEGSSSTTNIQVEASIRNLINIAAFLMDRQRSYKDAITALGVDAAPEFTWGGFSVADWLEDLKTRISKIDIAAKRKKLETLETRLNAIISPDLRAQLELEAIASEL
jgi:hypothetical protein